MQKRAAAVIIKGGEILLMRRIKNRREYFVFPGGGAKENESVQQALIRGIKEELILDIKIGKLLFEIRNQGRQESYLLITEFSGTPKLSGEEKERMNENNQYYPTFIKLNDIDNLNLLPETAKQKMKSLDLNINIIK